MELKTLKDIDWYCECENEDCTSKEILKEEAIKWIKKLQEEADLISMPKVLGERDSVIEFKKFFNITNEDLLKESIKNTEAPIFKKRGTKHITTS